MVCLLFRFWLLPTTSLKEEIGNHSNFLNNLCFDSTTLLPAIGYKDRLLSCIKSVTADALSDIFISLYPLLEGLKKSKDIDNDNHD